MLAGSIADSKLSKITAAGKVSGSAIDIGAGQPLYADISTGQLSLSVNNSTVIVNGSSQLAVGLATNSGLEDATGLKVKVATSTALGLSGSGLAWAFDNSTIGVNGSNQAYVKSSGITSTEIASNAVTTAKISDSQVTLAKLAAAAKPQQYTFATSDFDGSGVCTITHSLGTNVKVCGWIEQNDGSGNYTPTIANYQIAADGTVTISVDTDGSGTYSTFNGRVFLQGF